MKKNKRKLVFVGGGGHALSCSEVIESAGTHVIIGFFDPNKQAILGDCGYNYLGNDSHIQSSLSADLDWAIALGQTSSAKSRSKIFNMLASSGANLPTFFASSCYFSSGSTIGQGSMVFHKSFVNRGVNIGQNTIINSCALLEHGVTIGNHCHIAPKATILGDVTVQDECFVGAGAVLFPGVNIGKNSVVGASMVVKKHVPSGSIIK